MYFIGKTWGKEDPARPRRTVGIFGGTELQQSFQASNINLPAYFLGFQSTRRGQIQVVLSLSRLRLLEK